MSVARFEASDVTVLLDVRQPLAYLALAPARALAEEPGVVVDWLPVATPPLRPPSPPGADDDRGVRHRRYRARAIAREIETYADAQGLVLRDYYRDPDPGALNRGWLWMREQHPGRLQAFLAETFRAYWALELDPSDVAQVGAAVEALGADGAGFAAWCAGDGAGVAADLAEDLRERGFSRAPCYVVGDEVFIGRQHLPMIRWILGGRRGTVPI